MKTRRTIISAYLVSCIFGVAPALAQVVVSDSTFNDPDWNLTLVTKNAGGTVGAVQTGFFGNPAHARLVDHSIFAGTSTAPSAVAGLHINNTAVWNPFVDGALPGVDFSIDYDFAMGSVPGNVGIGALIEQGGTFYAAPLGGFPDPIGGGFDTLTACLFESDFAEVDFGTSTPLYDFSSTPDFSAAGSPIQFGFITSNSNSPSNPIAYQRRYVFDNFVASAKVVPEPSACGLMLLSALGLGLFRKR